MPRIKDRQALSGAVWEAVVQRPDDLIELAPLEAAANSGTLTTIDAAKSPFFKVLLSDDRDWQSFLKSEMLEVAAAHGVTATSDMTKAEIEQALNALDAPAAPAVDYDEMTKAELTALAHSMGLDGVREYWKKSEIIAALDAAS